MADMTSLINMWKQAQDAANKANEERYQQILGMYGGEGGPSMWDLSGRFGQTERRRISRGMKQSQSQAEQDLISRGLGGTTVRSAVRRGIRGQAEEATQSLEDKVARQRMDVLGGRIGATERRADVGPDAGLFSSLVSAAANQPSIPSMAGAGGYGGGYGGAGGTGQRATSVAYNFPPGWYDQFHDDPGSGGGAPAAGGGDSQAAFQSYIDRRQGGKPGTQRVMAGSALANVYKPGFTRAQQTQQAPQPAAAGGGMDWGGMLGGMGAGMGMGGLLSSLIPGMAGIGAGIGGLAGMFGGMGGNKGSWGLPENMFGSLFGG